MPNHQDKQIKSKVEATEALPHIFSSAGPTAAIPISSASMDDSYQKNQPDSSNHQHRHKPVASYQNDGWTPTNPVPESRDSVNDSLPKDSQLSH